MAVRVAAGAVGDSARRAGPAARRARHPARGLRAGDRRDAGAGRGRGERAGKQQRPGARGRSRPPQRAAPAGGGVGGQQVGDARRSRQSRRWRSGSRSAALVALVFGVWFALRDTCDVRFLLATWRRRCSSPTGAPSGPSLTATITDPKWDGDVARRAQARRRRDHGPRGRQGHQVARSCSTRTASRAAHGQRNAERPHRRVAVETCCVVRRILDYNDRDA